jgi:putative membrane protein
MDVHDLPLLNATLNAGSTLLLLAGYYFIRTKQIRRHRAMMIAALVCSAAFLTSYLVYHAQVGSVRFTGVGPVRSVYFAILISHTILAAALPVLAAITLTRALRERFDRHRAIARWTFPVWLYVSVTGVVIYLMLYRLFPSA